MQKCSFFLKQILIMSAHVGSRLIFLSLSADENSNIDIGAI